MFLSDDVQQELRRLNKINENEVLKKEGDLFIAINVIDQQRRIVTIENGLLERINKHYVPSGGQNRKILKG
jgi:hypothetical protein